MAWTDYEDADEARAAAVDELVEQYEADPAKCAEADEYAAGEQSAKHYNELEAAMADLDGVEPSDLLNSDVLTRLYRLAKQHGAARAKRIREMAEDAIAEDEDEREQARAEYIVEQMREDAA